MYKLFMEFENPTMEYTGIQQSVQGFAVYGDVGVILFHTGICAAYDLVSRSAKPIGVFKLGSYNVGEPDKRYTNHANDAMFGATIEGEMFPLLYVTAGNSGETDQNGYIAYCAVEQIRYSNGGFTSKTVQRIYYKNDEIESTRYQTPGWGWPASLVDAQGGWYYMLSARYRTTKDFSDSDNVYIITKFRLPDPKIGDVTLCPADIVDQFELPFNVFFTQGGTICNGKIYYMFGCGNEKHPNEIRVIDLDKREYALCESLSKTPFADDEVECCAFYNDRLLINTQKNKIYQRI